jgi:hypothetical protein
MLRHQTSPADDLVFCVERTWTRIAIAATHRGVWCEWTTDPATERSEDYHLQWIQSDPPRIGDWYHRKESLVRCRVAYIAWAECREEDTATDRARQGAFWRDG